MRILPADSLQTSIPTVSYTHLDVYKRQMYMWGPVKTFSIGDSGAERYDVPQWSLFASKLRDPGIMALREEQMTHGGGGFKDILWYDPTVGSEANDLSLDKFFGGMVELATMRSSWNDTNALFTGMRGGDANVNHGHMDLGLSLIHI